MAQSEKVGAMVEQRQCLKEESEVEEDRDDKEGFKDGSGENQEEETPLSTSYQYSGLG